VSNCVADVGVFLSAALFANRQWNVPASFISGEEEQNIDIGHLRAARFAATDHGRLVTEAQTEFRW